MRTILPARHDSRKAKKSYQGVKISNPQPIYSPKPNSISQLSLSCLEKFPSRSPSLQDSSRLTQSFSPLRSHTSPEPSTNLQPQPPHFSAIPPALQVHKRSSLSHLDQSDGFEQVELGTSSFVKEVDDKIARDFDVESLYSPDATDKGFFTNSPPSPELKRNLTLGSDTGRYRPRHYTTAFVEGISAGPYSTSENLTNNEKTYQKGDFENCMSARRIGICVYAVFIGAMVVAGVVLAAVAVSQKKGMSCAPVTVVLENEPVGSSTQPEISTSLLNFKSIHDWTKTTSNRSHSPKARMTPSSTSTNVSYQLLDSITKREEAASFEWPTETPWSTTVTVTVTNTIHLAPSRQDEPRNIAKASSREVKGLYAAPNFEEAPKRTIQPHHHRKTTTTWIAPSTKEHVIGHSTANAAAPRVKARLGSKDRRAYTTPTPVPTSVDPLTPSPTLSVIVNVQAANGLSIQTVNPATITPPPQINILPSHFQITPPPSWSAIPMLTYLSHALNADYSTRYYLFNTIPASLSSATPPPYTGPHLSKTWEDYYPFPIPTGYASPNIVPKKEQVGELTWNTPGTGACGFPDIRDNEYAVAISWVLFDLGREIRGSSLETGWQGMLPDGVSKDSSALCNRWINAWMDDGKGGRGTEHVFVVRDRCAACNVTHLDIQQGVFERFCAAGGLGRVQVTWEWMQEAPTSLPG